MTIETNVHRESRLAKLKALQDKGYNPYPYRFRPDAFAADLQEKYKELKQQKDLRPALSEAEIRRRKVLLKAAVEKLIQKYEQLMRVQVSGVTIRQMKTRWGSCNVKTHHININLALYEKGPECLEYVVVHEMCHILEASHNKIFWGYVAQYFPDWKNVRARLNEEGV